MTNLEKAKRAGVIAEMVNHLDIVNSDLKNARSIQIHFKNQNDYPRSYHIGHPGIEWPNDFLYYAVQEAVIKRTEEYKEELLKELKEMWTQ